MYIPTFKMPTIKQVLQLIQQDDYTFSVFSRMPFSHCYCLLSVTIMVIHLLWQNKHLK